MTKRKQKNKRSYFDLIPFDLFIDILSRLPVKSKAQCRCVSKLWSSSIRFPNYNQLFPIKSPAASRLLFFVKTGSKLSFYSSPQPLNLDKELSLVPTQYHTYLCKDFYKLCRPVGGLVCSHHIGKKHSWAVISNPMTGEYVTTPKVTGDARYTFGYDPIDKQFKVLRITWLYLYPNPAYDNLYAEYHVLTLGTEHRNLLWRKILCCTFHYPIEGSEICINGVLYYLAIIPNKKHTIVSFDVRYEKFSFINFYKDSAKKFSGPFILINYKGKLGVGCNIYHDPFVLLVLEDAEKHIWSKHIYKVPSSLPARRTIAGMTGSGEIVLYPIRTRDPLFISYYNLEKNIITRVGLEVPVVGESRVYTYPNYEEDLKLM